MKQETTAMPACYVPLCLKKKHNARKAVWFTTATVIGAISAFVDSIDSHIILRMIRESKISTGVSKKAPDNVFIIKSQNLKTRGVKI